MCCIMTLITVVKGIPYSGGKVLVLLRCKVKRGYEVTGLSETRSMHG